MPRTPSEIARRALADHLAALPPAELLSRYATRRDPEAFAGLVQQFGPMVFGVCRRVLGCSADVDDAFQAVFLSLARQADSFRDARALPAWLHRVSRRVAHKALARRVPAGAPPETIPDPADPLADVTRRDLRRVLDEELDRLPDKYRGPIVLCWLDGLTQDEAAGKLGVSLATLKRQLELGRELLRSRLLRRGVAPVVVTAAVFDVSDLRSAVPDALAVRSVELGVPGAAIPPTVEVLQVVAVTAPAQGYFKVVLALVLIGGIATASAMRLYSPPQLLESPKQESLLPLLVQFDGAEEPLPPGAVARFGSVRFRVPGKIRNSFRPSSLTPDGRLIAVSAYNDWPFAGSLSIYETTTWKLIHRSTGSDFVTGRPRVFLSAAGPVFLSPDGAVVTYAIDNNWQFWQAGRASENKFLSDMAKQLHFLDLRTGQRGHFYPGPERVDKPPGPALGRFRECRQCRYLGFTPDGLLMEQGVGCLDLNSKQVVRPLPVDTPLPPQPPPPRTPPTLVRPLPVGTWDGNLTRFNEDHIKSGFGTSPDGNVGAGLDKSGTELRVWRAHPERQAEPWTVLWVFRTPGAATPGEVMAWEVQRSPCAWIAQDNRSVALVMKNGDLSRWDLDTGQELPRLVAGESSDDRGFRNYHVLPGGQQILTPCADGTIRIWDATTGSEIPVPGQYSGVLCVRASGDGRFVALADRTGRVDLLDGRTGQLVRCLYPPGGRIVLGLAVNDDGTVAVCEQPNSQVREVTRFLDPTNGREAPDRAFPLGPNWRSPEWRNNSDSSTQDGRVRVQEPGTKVEVIIRNFPANPNDLSSRTVVLDAEGVARAIISPDGKRVLTCLALGLTDERATSHWSIWDVESGQFVARVPPSDTPLPLNLNHVLFAGDCKSLITFDQTGVGYRWDVEKLIASQKK